MAAAQHSLTAGLLTIHVATMGLILARKGRSKAALVAYRARRRFGRPRWFLWGNDTDMARPDAWCHDCERALRQGPAGATTETWFETCEFKVLCAACWDHARSVLYEHI
jgi:hypothetical protein